MELLNQMDGFDQNVNVKVPHAAPYAIHAIQSRLHNTSDALFLRM